ncbi:hypothetical protein NL108_015417 [Boleophthalmus pectinirostris]|nr:hypothetical protein NL108_015417 [Boleophthalmus pectinirostris]
MQMCINGYTDALRFLSDSGQEQSQNLQRRSLDSVKNRLKICRDKERGDKESSVLPGDISQVLILACSEPPPRPAHFSDPPVLHIVLGLVLDLLLVLIQLVLLPFGLLIKLSIRLLSVCSCRSSTSNLQKRPMTLDKNRNLMSTQGKKN